MTYNDIDRHTLRLREVGEGGEKPEYQEKPLNDELGKYYC